MEARHRVLAEIALAAAGSYGLALAGGYAVRAHGIGSRPSGDVDLFTDWQRPSSVRTRSHVGAEFCIQRQPSAGSFATQWNVANSQFLSKG
jgi:hypothetical protein